MKTNYNQWIMENAETLFEFAYTHVNSLYRRGRFLGCLIEDCKQTPGAKVPQPIGRRGQEYIYRVEELTAAYRAVSRHYKRTKLCTPRSVQLPNGLYCNIPALVEAVKLDHHTVKEIVRKHKVRHYKKNAGRTLWHLQDAIEVIELMRPTLFDFDHALNRPLTATDNRVAAPVPPRVVLPKSTEELDDVDLETWVVVAAAVLVPGKGSKVSVSGIELPRRNTTVKAIARHINNLVQAVSEAGSKMEIPAGIKE